MTPIELRYHSTAARWARFGIVIWWLLFLIAVGWSWFIVDQCVSDYHRWHNPAAFWSAENMTGMVVVWIAGVLPFLAWILLRWIVTGRWLLTP